MRSSLALKIREVTQSQGDTDAAADEIGRYAEGLQLALERQLRPLFDKAEIETYAQLPKNPCVQLLGVSPLRISGKLPVKFSLQKSPAKTPVPAPRPPQEGIASEIEKATQDFISLVRRYPEQFPGVDPQVLEAIRPDYEVHFDRVQLCDGTGILEAYSNSRENRAHFDFSSWITKERWIEKVLLAGHERLVLAGYETSNRYDLSSQIFELERRQRQVGGKSLFPTQTSLCQYGERVCSIAKRSQDQLDLVARYPAEDPDHADQKRNLLKITKEGLGSLILVALTLKEAELRRQTFIFQDPEDLLLQYIDEVEAGLRAHFEPLLAEAERSINARPSPAPCVPAGEKAPSRTLAGALSDVLEIEKHVRMVPTSKDCRTNQ